MLVDIVVSLGVMLITVYLLAIITDSFFIVSLDRISRELSLSDDVAGASLMAVGSSAPELCIALIALFQEGGAHSDVGIGTIVGSAVFNVLVITGLSAIAAGDLMIHMFSVRRDTAYYLLSIGYLLVIFQDGEIAMVEAVVGVLAYALYIAVLIFWKDPDPEPKEPEGDEKREVHPYPTVTESPFRRVEAAIVRVIKMITGAPNENYVWTFIVAIAFIVALSYALVQYTLTFSDAVGLSPVIVALTLLAAGTSAPDLISSIDVARDGRGGMAVANAIGSNIFDIFIGLGLPWIITLIFIRPDIHVASEGLWVSIGLLAGTVLILFFFLTTGRRLSRREGYALLGLYVAYVLYTIASN